MFKLNTAKSFKCSQGHRSSHSQVLTATKRNAKSLLPQLDFDFKEYLIKQMLLLLHYISEGSTVLCTAVHSRALVTLQTVKMYKYSCSCLSNSEVLLLH